MKRKKGFYLCLFVLLLFAASFTSVSAEEIKVFTDVSEGAWYYDAIQDAYKFGLIQGITATTFSPGSDIERGDFVVILGRLHEFLLEQDIISGQGINETNKNYFTDVNTDAYYAKYINWAYENNLINGYEDGTFGPEEKLTREQMAVIIYRYLQEFNINIQNTPVEINDFNDVNLLSSWATEEIRYLQGYSIISGYQNEYHPQDHTTRAEAATFYINVVNAIGSWDVIE
jgi:hypothetical protein